MYVDNGKSRNEKKPDHFIRLISCRITFHPLRCQWIVAIKQFFDQILSIDGISVTSFIVLLACHFPCCLLSILLYVSAICCFFPERVTTRPATANDWSEIWRRLGFSHVPVYQIRAHCVLIIIDYEYFQHVVAHRLTARDGG